MSANGISDYKFGDELFRYVDPCGVFRYVVIGRRERGDEVQLEVECKTCSHGYQCQLLLAQNDYGRIIAVHMLNDDAEDSQRHWHGNDEGLHFCSTSDEARQEQVRRLVRRATDNVNKCKESLAAAEKRLAEVKGLIEDVQP
jgi:hypothetical protein